MTKFSEFGIKPKSKAFEGDKIKISKILNLEITVHDFKIGPSKFSGDRLDIQIELDGKKYVTWTGSSYMIEMIKEVPLDKFPFTTKIIEEHERYVFS